MLEIWCQIHLKLISHLQDAGALAWHKNTRRTAQNLVPVLFHAQDLVPGLGLAQELVRPADEKSLLVPACTWICAFRLVYSKNLPGG